MVKIPKKLRSIFHFLRKGEIEIGLKELKNVKGFETQKNLINSQINYFQEEYETAMEFDEKALPFDNEWYAGNIIQEHFFAYSNSAIFSNQIEKAETFYKKYLEDKIGQSLPEHKINFYRHQTTQHLQKIRGKKDLMIDTNKVKLIEKGEPIEKFIEQYKRVNNENDYRTQEAVNYILYFLIEYGNSHERLEYYEKNLSFIQSEESHLKVAQLYKATNQVENAKKAILRFAINCWYPIEHLQIVPMKIWTYEDLIPILTKEIKMKILKSDKEKK